MTWIINYFKSLGNLIVSIVTMLMDIVKGGIQLIKMLPEYLNYIAEMYSILPAWITIFCLGVISIWAIWALRKAL